MAAESVARNGLAYPVLAVYSLPHGPMAVSLYREAGNGDKRRLPRAHAVRRVVELAIVPGDAHKATMGKSVPEMACQLVMTVL